MLNYDSFRYIQNPLKNRIITHKINIADKFIIFFTCLEDFCGGFFFHHICNVTLQSLSCYLEWNLQLINQYLRHDIWIV